MQRRRQRISITTLLSRLSWPTCLAIAAAIWLVFHVLATMGAPKPGPMPPPGQFGAALVPFMIGSVCGSLQWFGPAVFLFFRFVGWLEGKIERKVG